MSFGRSVTLTLQEEGSAGIEIKDLRIKFNVLKTENTEPNEAEIQVYNLTRETYHKVAKTDNLVILKAGYEDDGGVKVLFTGEISKPQFLSEATETRMILDCFDGLKGTRGNPISLSYKKDTQLSTILRDVLKEIPLTVAKQPTISGITYKTGYSFVGNAKDALAEILARAGYTYNIQNNEIYIMGETETIETKAFLISPETGLIGSPTELAETDSETVEPDGKKKYSIKSLLNSSISPGSFIQLKSRDTNGFFKAFTVEQIGDNWDGSFETNMEVYGL